VGDITKPVNVFSWSKHPVHFIVV